MTVMAAGERARGAKGKRMGGRQGERTQDICSAGAFGRRREIWPRLFIHADFRQTFARAWVQNMPKLQVVSIVQCCSLHGRNRDRISVMSSIPDRRTDSLQVSLLSASRASTDRVNGCGLRRQMEEGKCTLFSPFLHGVFATQTETD